MAIVFHAASGSPYVWRVWLALEHKKIPYELRIHSFDAGDLARPEFRAVNPRGKVPAIEDGGFALYESPAIVEYLERIHPTSPLFPEHPHAGAIVRRLICEADLYVQGPLEAMVDQVLFAAEGKRDAGALAKARDAFVAELMRWDFEQTPYLAGETVTAADHALYPMIALARRMETRFGGFAVMDDLGPQIASWMKRIEALPYYDKTYPPHWRG